MCNTTMYMENVHHNIGTMSQSQTFSESCICFSEWQVILKHGFDQKILA